MYKFGSGGAAQTPHPWHAQVAQSCSKSIVPYVTRAGGDKRLDGSYQYYVKSIALYSVSLPQAIADKEYPTQAGISSVQIHIEL